MGKVLNNIVIENAIIRFRNFAGKPDKFNPAGKRNFCVFLEKDIAETLARDGWNVKYLKPRNEGDEEQAYMQVAVSYEYYPPKIILITSSGRTTLDEETVDTLDWAEIENVDLTIRPYNWEVNGKEGVAAYLKSMYVTIVEDQLDKKYSREALTEDETF